MLYCVNLHTFTYVNHYGGTYFMQWYYTSGGKPYGILNYIFLYGYEMDVAAYYSFF